MGLLYIFISILICFSCFFYRSRRFLIFVYFAFVLVGCCKVCIDYNFKRMQWLIIVRFTCTCVSDSGEYRISARFSVVWIRLVVSLNSIRLWWWYWIRVVGLGFLVFFIYFLFSLVYSRRRSVGNILHTLFQL